MRAQVGQPVRRIEDAALLTGRGRFVDDIRAEGMLAAFVVRAEVAHARFAIRNLDTVRADPAARLVLVHEDIAGLGPMPVRNIAPRPDGSRTITPERRVLADDVVRFVGEPVAFVVADDAQSARELAEMVEIDYVPLPVATGGRAALETGAPVLHPELASNEAFEYRLGDAAATDEAFRRAAHVTRVQLDNNRVAAAYLETRGVVAEYDAAAARYTLTLGCQGAHVVRRMLAQIMGIEEQRLRVIVPDVGGAFGTKIFTYPEYVLAAVAAERLRLPVKWIASRHEHFVGDTQGRDSNSIAEMAMDADGRFLAMRLDTVANLGAYCSEVAGFVPTNTARMATGSYVTPTFSARVRGAYTNTMPVDAYRGAGRPEASYLIERLVDACARDLGMEPAEIRRRNFIRSDQMPYMTPSGWLYDTGDFEGHLERALVFADHAGFAQRAAESASRGMLRGIGIAAHIDACVPVGKEEARLRLEADGTVTLLIGTQTGGQGHATAYSQFVAEALDIPYETIRVKQGDTDLIATGGGTGGSRSIPLGAPSVHAAARLLADRIKAVASDMLEAASSDLELREGRVRIAGTDRSVEFAAVATAAGPGMLTAGEAIETTERTFPNGTHVAEVEIDPETGHVEIANYSVVDDFGFVVNPMLLEGQIHGGVAQGAGQALHERIVFDETGQLLTASFLDYGVPRADDLPSFHFETRNIPARTNPLGIKGAGEAGTVGSAPAVMNAVADALHRVGVTEWIDMPATPERVWRALSGLREGAGAT